MEDTILTLSEKLIRIPSVSDDKKQCKKALSVIKRELKGFNVRTFSKNNTQSLLFYTAKKSNHTHRIILNAHVDVVPGKKEQFEPKRKGNRLYARGAYDMKAASAALVLVFKELAHDVPYDLALQIVTDEEVGGQNGTKFQIEKGVHASFVLTGENSDLQIDNQSKGIVRVRLTSKGKTAHGAYPWLGDNAILKLTKAIDAILTIYPVPRKEVWRTTVNLASITTNNTASNKVPSHAEAVLDIRYIPKDEDTIVKKIKKVLPKGVEMTLLRKDPATYTDENNPYVSALKQSIKAVTGKNAQTISKHGSSDIRFYTEKGVPAVALGPKGDGHHSDEEWVDLKSLNTYYEIVKDFLLTV